MTARRHPGEPFLRSLYLVREAVSDLAQFPYCLPAVRGLLGGLPLHPRVTFLIGENGDGKSTIVEAIAISAGFNPEGGSRNFQFTTRASESDLQAAIRLVRGARRPRDGFFFSERRATSTLRPRSSVWMRILGAALRF